MIIDDLEALHLCRQMAWQNGYRPIPILCPGLDVDNAGKRPAGSGPCYMYWEKDARQDPPYGVSNHPTPNATNTGILCDGLQAVDIDIDDADLADAVDRLCVEMLGDAPMRYREDSPRRLRLYRAAEGEPSKIQVKEDLVVASAAGRKPYGVEVLGHGQQFLAIGYHPDGAFLEWRGGNPTTVAREALKAVSTAQVAEFLTRVGELIGAKPPRQNRQNRQNPPVVEKVGDGDGGFGGFGGFGTPDRSAALVDVLAALAIIPGDDGSYDIWIRVGQAIHAATDGSGEGLAAWVEWSKKSPPAEPANCAEVWRSFKPHSITFGTLVYMAQQADPTWRAPSWDHSEHHADDADATLPTRIAVAILDRTVAPPPPLPLAVFGTDWGEWLQKAAVAASAPTDYVATTLLAVAGSLIGNARWGKAWPGWAEPSVLWCALVGEPSASKTPAANAVMKLLSRVESDMGEGYDEIRAAWEEATARAKAERKQWEASLAGGDDTPMPRSTIPLEPMRPLASTGSVTIEKAAAMMQAQPKGFLVAQDELAGWLGNLQRYSGGNDRPFYLSAWTGSSYRVDRVTSATAIIPCLSLGIFGTIQPDRLATALKGADDGLPARFLFSWPNARQFARPRGTVDVSRATQALCRLGRLQMQTDENDTPVPVLVAATDEAAGVLEAFGQEMQVQERKVGGVMIGVLGKARGYALRLATVLEFLQWAWHADRREPTEISAKAMRRAVELMRDYFLPMAARVLGDAAITQQERDARTLGKWIDAERPSKINLRALSRGETGGTPMHGLRDRKRLDAAAVWLKDSGWFQPAPAGRMDGRPRSDYLVADALWSALNEHACQNRQNRQNSVRVETEEGFGGFGGFVSPPADNQEEGLEPTSDSGGDDGAAQAKDGGDEPPPATVAPTLPPLFRNGYQPDVPDGDVSTLLNRMIAKRQAAFNHGEL